jgi:preprotein translocase subunit SecA
VHSWINKALEKAQQKVEARNFDIRKNILKYDNVMNDQRKVIFDQRIGLMRGEEVSETVNDMRHQVVDSLIAKHIPENAYAEQWNASGLRANLAESVGVDFPMEEWVKEEGIAEEEIRERVVKAVDEIYGSKREQYGPEIMNQVEKAIVLQTLDRLWRDHIVTNDYLRQVIHLRGYGQRDPLNEYKSESFEMFSSMVDNLKERVTAQLMRVQVQARAPGEEDDDMLMDEDELPEMEAHHLDPFTGEDDVGEGGVLSFDIDRNAAIAAGIDPDNPEQWGERIGRNDLCPCGSGKRFKHCHGRLT